MEPRTESKFARFLGSYSIVWIAAALILETAIAGLAGMWVINHNRGACNPPTLVLGTTEYTIKTVQPGSDGSLQIPEGQPGTAYWLEGTNTNQIFGLSQTEEYQSLRDALKSGTTATVTWANCNSISYVLGDTLPETQDLASLMDQSIFGITVLVQPGASAAGFAVRGEMQEATIKTFDTPEPSSIQAEVSLLGITASEDGRTIKIAVSVLNTGQVPATLSANDVSLAAENGVSSPPETSEPALPEEIRPGETQEFSFTFARPASRTATLKLLGIEYGIEGY